MSVSSSLQWLVDQNDLSRIGVLALLNPDEVNACGRSLTFHVSGIPGGFVCSSGECFVEQRCHASACYIEDGDLDIFLRLKTERNGERSMERVGERLQALNQSFITDPRRTPDRIIERDIARPSVRNRGEEAPYE